MFMWVARSKNNVQMWLLTLLVHLGPELVVVSFQSSILGFGLVGWKTEVGVQLT